MVSLATSKVGFPVVVAQATIPGIFLVNVLPTADKINKLGQNGVCWHDITWCHVMFSQWELLNSSVDPIETNFKSLNFPLSSSKFTNT